MKDKTEAIAVSLIGCAGVLLAIVLSPPLLSILMGIELSSLLGQGAAWATTIFLLASSIMLIVRRHHVPVRTVVAVLAYVMCMIALIEGILQIATRVNPSLDYVLSRRPQIIPDPALEYRFSPLHPEHDERGFRNPGIPDTIELVAIGDSQTYGSNAAKEDSYPAQLSALFGISSYNMAAGGYSPPQYLALTDEAIDLDPKIIVAGLYAGNDLSEAYGFVYRKGRAPELIANDLSLIEALRERETREPPERDFGGDGDRLKTPNLLRAILHILISIFVTDEMRWEQHKRLAEINNDFILETPGWRTIFTPQIRFRALDLSDIRIREGLRISLEVLERMRTATREKGIQFLVLLIPTKELVYNDVISGLKDYPVPDVFHKLIAVETDAWANIKMGLDQRGIAYIDALPQLRQALLTEEKVYPINRDGHPRAAGHRAIAGMVAGAVKNNSMGASAK
jgi:hypothetical protein